MIFIKKYGGYDISKLELLGRGTQGKVYKIDSGKCIKVFKSKSVCKGEADTLKMAQGDKHFAKLYDSGQHYIVRECIDGIELNKYLKTKLLSIDISAKILDVYEALGRVGYARQDIALFHIFVTPEGEFKIIDTGRVMKKKSTYPKIMLTGLKTLGCREEFLIHVKMLRPELYKRWSK
ncbi:putative Ser/Thr protein kinase [Clostridium pascui]|uniref:hypothetical protein n=1 Tax=Clostridium pascui TaxID=46609 RepID=UPI00195B9A45|nr:hypothetical protein [Clostridium pascui]MBM7871817.1 putative Ser/Thr protein kinase [Clostridium pascui]